MKCDSTNPLSGLKRDIAGIERQCREQDRPAPVPIGHAAIDRVLGGGILPACLHDIYAAESGDAASAAGFAAMLACQRRGSLVWIRAARAAHGRLFAEGLVDIGYDPSTLLLCTVADAKAALRAANDASLCAGASTVVVELWRAQPLLTLTAGRRLAMAADSSGATVLMLRIDVEPCPSVATTRWQVAAAPSIMLPAQAPGFPAFDLTLLRQRGRAETGTWRVVWNADDGVFQPFADIPAALPRALRTVPAMRPADPGIERRAA